jgi:hypothetical protein
MRWGAVRLCGIRAIAPARAAAIGNLRSPGLLTDPLFHDSIKQSFA